VSHPIGDPDPSDCDAVNVRAECYCIARTQGTCTRCGGKTRLVALVMPPSHETLSAVDGHGDEPDSWQVAGSAAFLFYIGYLPDPVRQRVQAVAEAYRRAQSPVTHGSYWANHCEHCDTLQEDHDLFCEPEGAFLATSAGGAAAIELARIDEPFEAAAAGYDCEPQFLEFMTRT
jgi:hypothetical protein